MDDGRRSHMSSGAVWRYSSCPIMGASSLLSAAVDHVFLNSVAITFLSFLAPPYHR